MVLSEDESQQTSPLVVDPLQYETCLEEYITELVDEISLGFCFEVHRSAKIGTFFIDEIDDKVMRQYAIVDQHGLDVFGNPPQKKQFDCVCPNCQRSLAAIRFAPHLEKCMGMGRCSSRLASRRQATKDKVGGGADSDNENYDYDSVWVYPDRKGGNTRKKVAKQMSSSQQGMSNNNHNTAIKMSPRIKLLKKDVSSIGSNHSECSITSLKGNSSVTATPPITVTSDHMTMEDKKRMLLQVCGVVSEHTNKMCARSLHCHLHTSDQRRSVRNYLLSKDAPIVRTDGTIQSEELQIDIDSLDDIGSHLLSKLMSTSVGLPPSSQETSQQSWETASVNSPADSVKSYNSNTTPPGSGKKRKKKAKRLLAKRKKVPKTVYSQNPAVQMLQF